VTLNELPLPARRSPVVIADGRVILSGLLIYDPLADSLQTANIAVVSNTRILQLSDGRLFTAGSDLIPPCAQCPIRYWTSIFDPKTNAVISGPSFPASAAITLSDDRVLMPPIFDPVSNQFAPSAAERVSMRCLTLLPDGRVLGIGSPSNVNSTPPYTSDVYLYIPPGLQARNASVTSVTPYTLAGSWTGITVAGSNFASNAAVTVGGTRLTTIYQGSTQLTAFVPQALASSLATNGVSVVNLSSTAATQGPFPPAISGISPNVITAGSWIAATLTGSNLSGATAVTISGDGVTASIQTGGSATQLNLTLTAAGNATPGFRSVTVTTPAGSSPVNSVLQVQPTPLTGSNSTPQSISEVEQGSIRTGYVIVTPDPTSPAPAVTATFGIVNGGLAQSQAAMFPGPLATDAILFVDAVPGIGRNLGVAIANPGNTANTITLTLRDRNGTILGTPATLSLQPQQQSARFVSELIPSNPLGAFQGTLEVQGAVPLSVLGFLFNGTPFSTIPVTTIATVSGVPSRTLASGSVTNTPLAGTVGGATAIALPHFAMGGGWATQLALVNGGSTSISGRVDVFDVSGNPMAVKLNGNTQSSFTYAIAPGGMTLIAPRDSNGQSPF
jgi:hypothetical protein